MFTQSLIAGVYLEDSTMGGLYTPWVIPYGLFFGWVSSHFFSPYPLWNPYGFHGTFHVRNLIRIVMNVFKFNLTPLLYSLSGQIHLSIMVVA